MRSFGHNKIFLKNAHYYKFYTRVFNIIFVLGEETIFLKVFMNNYKPHTHTTISSCYNNPNAFLLRLCFTNRFLISSLVTNV